MLSNHMKVTGMRNILAIIACQFFAAQAFGADFQIKDMALGLKLKDYKDHYLCSPSSDGLVSCHDMAPSLTVGGEKIKSFLVKFDREETASMILLKFSSDSFEGIRDAIVTKYPKIKCTKSAIKTRMGVELETENCAGSTKLESIVVNKHSGTITEGSILMVTVAAIDESAKQRKQKASDI